MCLTLPGQIDSIDTGVAIVDYNGEKREASTMLMPDVKKGDWVIVSAKMITQTVPAEEARKSLELWDQTK